MPAPADPPVILLPGMGADRIIPPSRTRPDHVVPGAGHALSVSHPEAVTAFLRAHLT